MMDLVNNIEDKLLEHDMTAKELAEMVSISYQKMNKIISGFDPRGSEMIAIAAVFGCDVLDIWKQIYTIKKEEVVTEKTVLSFAES